MLRLKSLGSQCGRAGLETGVCSRPSFTALWLHSLKVGGIEKDYTLFPARPVLSSLGRWVIRKPSLWSCSGYLR